MPTGHSTSTWRRLPGPRGRARRSVAVARAAQRQNASAAPVRRNSRSNQCSGRSLDLTRIGSPAQQCTQGGDARALGQPLAPGIGAGLGRAKCNTGWHVCVGSSLEDSTAHLRKRRRPPAAGRTTRCSTAAARTMRAGPQSRPQQAWGRWEGRRAGRPGGRRQRRALPALGRPAHAFWNA